MQAPGAELPEERNDLTGFLPYLLVAVVHVFALAVGNDTVADPTKLLLMPLLALAVVWHGRGLRQSTPALTLLLAAIALSWLGDGAGTFFPFAPTLPMMLLFFGLAHFGYIWLFRRYFAIRQMPRWAFVYAVWWVVLVVILWPHLGGLAFPVAAYGLVLGATAALSTCCHPVVAWGGALFLASDTILAFRLFIADVMPAWTSPMVMATYTLGQGLIALGALVSLRGSGQSEIRLKA